MACLCDVVYVRVHVIVFVCVLVIPFHRCVYKCVLFVCACACVRCWRVASLGVGGCVGCWRVCRVLEGV